MPNKSGRPSDDSEPAKYAGVGGPGESGSLRYRDAEAELLRDTIDAVTQDGDAVMFGRTSDGGALSISVYSSGRRKSLYAVSLDQLLQTLVELRQAAST